MYVNVYEEFRFIDNLHLKTIMVPAQMKNQIPYIRYYGDSCLIVRSSVLVSMTFTFFSTFLSSSQQDAVSWTMKSMSTSYEWHRSEVVPASQSWVFRVFRPHADVSRLIWPHTHLAACALHPPRWKHWRHQHLQDARIIVWKDTLVHPTGFWSGFVPFILYSAKEKIIKHFVWITSYLFYLFWFQQNVFKMYIIRRQELIYLMPH